MVEQLEYEAPAVIDFGPAEELTLGMRMHDDPDGLIGLRTYYW